MARSNVRRQRYEPRNGSAYVGYSEIDRAEVGILKTRVTNIEADIHDLRETIQAGNAGLSAQIASVTSKIDDRSKVQWPAMMLLLTVVITIGSLVYWPIRESQQRTVDVLDRLIASTVPRTEVDIRFQTGAQRRDDIQRLTDERIGANSRDIAALEAKLVPRGEHEQMWAAQRQKDQDLQRQIDATAKAFGDLYSPRDALNRLISRLDALERELSGRRGTPPG